MYWQESIQISVYIYTCREIAHFLALFRRNVWWQFLTERFSSIKLLGIFAKTWLLSSHVQHIIEFRVRQTFNYLLIVCLKCHHQTSGNWLWMSRNATAEVSLTSTWTEFKKRATFKSWLNFIAVHMNKLHVLCWKVSVRQERDWALCITFLEK